MNAEVKALWVEALRSGRYKQGRGYLCQISPDGSFHYCCLGVLCEVLHMPRVIAKTAFGKSCIGYGKEEITTTLPLNAVHEADLGQRSPLLPAEAIPDLPKEYEREKDELMVALADLNDAGVPFDKIADLIEKYL